VLRYYNVQPPIFDRCTACFEFFILVQYYSCGHTSFGDSSGVVSHAMSVLRLTCGILSLTSLVAANGLDMVRVASFSNIPELTKPVVGCVWCS
jgi:hypothetical protein